MKLRFLPCFLPFLCGCSSAPLPALPGWEEHPLRDIESGTAAGPLRAGAARRSISPPYAIPMAGYVAASWFDCRQARDDISARALVLECGRSRFAWVSVESSLIPPGLRGEVEREPAWKRAGVQFWILGATHTHTAPGGQVRAWPAELFGTGSFDPLARRRLAASIAAAVESAAAGLRPAVLRLSRAQVADFSFNRKIPGGAYDPELAVLSVFPREAGAANDAPIARLLRFAAHPTLIPFYLRRISGDYPGVCMRLLEKDGSVDLFTSGPSGDLAAGRPDDFPPSTWERRLEAMGSSLAIHALAAEAAAGSPLDSGADAADIYRIDTVQGDLLLPPRLPWRVPLAGRSIASHYPDRIGLRGMRLSGPGMDLFLAAFPGEMGVELGAQVAANLAGALSRAGPGPGPVIWPWTLADDYLGYVFSTAAFQAGGKSGHLTAYGESMGDHVARAWTALAAVCPR